VRRELLALRVEDRADEQQAVLEDLVVRPLEALGRGILDVDRYATELHDPEITEPAGAGNVPSRNYRLIGALAVKRGELPRDELDGFDLDIANNAKLLRELERVDRERAARGDGPAPRSARYMCVAAYVGNAGEIFRSGSIEGRVVEKPRGTAGFGYDAHVEVPELGATMAEADWRSKSQVSHRGRAFRALLPALRGLGWA